MAQFFAGIAQHVAEPSVETHDFLATGTQVIALLTFRGRGKKTGTPFQAHEAHFWTLRDGKVVSTAPTPTPPPSRKRHRRSPR